MIFPLTSYFVVPQKDFRFFVPCSSAYQTTPFQRPSVRLKMFPFVSNFRCIFQPPFSATHNTTETGNSQGHSAEFRESYHLGGWFGIVFIANGIPLSAMRQALSGGKGFHCLCAAIPEGGKHPLPRPCRPGAWSVSRLPLPVSVWPAPPDHRRRSRAPTPPRCPAPSGVRR